MNLSTFWLCTSLLLCLAELLLPGQIALGLGLSGLAVTLLLWTGIITTGPVAVVLSLAASIPIVLGLRACLEWMLPGDAVVQSTDEDAALEGQVVQVVETIEPGGEGRVAFGDSSWPAMSLKERLVAGQPARLLMRSGLVWVVKPVEWSDDSGNHPEPSGSQQLDSRESYSRLRP